MVQALRSKLAASSLITSEVPYPPSVSTDYESPVASGGGDYVTTISLGTPAKVFSVIADTGSDLIWIQCKPCQACFNQKDPIFDPEGSSSYTTMSCGDTLCDSLPRKSCSPDCDYSYGYGDGSGTRGTLSSETVTLTSTQGEKLAAKNIAFGCGHLNRGSFNDASGLVGLGRGNLSFVSQLGDLFGHKFSYCLVPWRDAPSKTSPMFFGDESSSHSSGKKLHYAFTPMIHNPAMESFYYVKLKDISIAGRALRIPAGSFDIKPDGSGGMIFDSGTTLTLLPDAPYQIVLRALRSKISFPKIDGSSAGLDLCYDVSGSKASYKMKIPAMVFHFEGADYQLPVENYFIAANDAGTIVCLAMVSSNMDIGIYGNMMQQNFRVMYDIGSSKIGWAPSQCDSSQ
ncbi:hypothetical protein SELMODRAFT_87804 [Selaginella moellendorffii]|uniref:nepenthesin n=2 Tax=Selaginella moellendorffii TaxID=88036 RepID=D8R8T4_SELML|nr:hypothetical protein SELMODRAFT_87804 [Selaginella moellendorffii]